MQNLTAHPTLSGFRDLDWGGNPHGIYMTAGPDWMHMMLEGLGKHLLTYTIKLLKDARELGRVDQYIRNLERRSSVQAVDLRKIASGIESIHLLSAKEMPGVLMQLALAIGDTVSTKVNSSYLYTFSVRLL